MQLNKMQRYWASWKYHSFISSDVPKRAFAISDNVRY